MPIFKAISKKGRVKPRHPLFTVLPVLGLFFLLGLILWYSYPGADDEATPTAVPVIRADAGPYKVVPSDPGGMEIPYRDSTVFDTLRQARLEEGGEPTVESLLPPREETEPVDREALFAGLKTEVKQDMEEPEATAAAETAEETVEEVAAEDIAESEDQDMIAEGKIVKVEPESRIQPAQKPAVETSQEAQEEPGHENDAANGAAATEPAAGDAAKRIAGTGDYQPDPQGGYYVQLGSFRSRGDAKTGWQGAQTQFPSLLKALELHVERADLGERGVFYRMQAGPLDKQAAGEICTAIKSEKPGGCLVVSR